MKLIIALEEENTKMSFDNLQVKWSKQETNLLISLVRDREITDLDLMDEALEKIPTRNKGGIKRKLERLEKDGKLQKLITVLSENRLKPQAKEMICMLSEEYSLDEIAYGIGVTIDEINFLLSSDTKEKVVETPKNMRLEISEAIRAGETTLELVAINRNISLEEIQTQLTPFFKKELDEINQYVAEYADPNIKPFTQITTNILTGYKLNYNKTVPLRELKDLINFVVYGKMSDNG